MDKKLLLYSLGFLLLFIHCTENQQTEPLSVVLERGLQRATEQVLLMAKEVEEQEGQFPKTTHPDGSLSTSTNVPRDASSAAIMASALIELSQLSPTPLAQECLVFAEAQLRSLSSLAYLAGKGENNYFTIMHYTGHLPGNSEIDVPLSYADYYYVEALMRMKQLTENR